MTKRLVGAGQRKGRGEIGVQNEGGGCGLTRGGGYPCGFVGEDLNQEIKETKIQG